jgi:ComF family protein
MIGEERNMSTKLKLRVYSCMNIAQYFLLPGTCIVCNRSSLRQQDLCEKCESLLPLIVKPCQRCALPLPPGDSAGTICGRCLTNPPPFLCSISAFEYSPPVNRLISDFKYYGKLCNGRVLAACLQQNLQNFYSDKALPELIIPVPLHNLRLRERGYNQANELSQYLSRETGIPVNHRLFCRVQDTPRQMGLSAQERRQNLRQAFALSSNADIASLKKLKKIAIVDDVVTTMSTITELSKQLLKNGIEEIHIWSIARTCK